MHQPRIRNNSTAQEIAYKRTQFESLLRSMDELIPILEKLDAKIALENMPGDTWEFQSYLLDNYPAEQFGFCFDSGHANINYQLDKCYKYRNRICALHLHDNNGTDDKHTAPFTDSLDWDLTAEIIRESGYRGVLTYELHIKESPFMNKDFPLEKQPEANVKAFLADAIERCRKFAEMCKK